MLWVVVTVAGKTRNNREHEIHACMQNTTAPSERGGIVALGSKNLCFFRVQSDVKV